MPWKRPIGLASPDCPDQPDGTGDSFVYRLQGRGVMTSFTNRRAVRSPAFARWVALAWVAGALLAWLLPWSGGADGVPSPWMAPLFWPTGLIQAFPAPAFLLAWLLPLGSLLCWRIGMGRWALLLACLAGGLHTLLPAYAVLADTPVFDERVDCHLKGVVRGLVDDRPDRRRFSLELVQAWAVDTDHPAARRVCDELPRGGRVKLSDYTAAEARAPLRSGFRYQLQARLKPLRGHANPGGFDYRRWLFRHRILSTGYLREMQPVALGSAPGLTASIERLRGGAQTRLRAGLEHATRVAMAPERLVAAPGLLQGLAIGDRNQLEQEQWEVLLASGTNHLLAISGLHVGMMAALAGLLFRGLWRCHPASGRIPAQRVGAVAAVLAAWAYALIAGLSIPTLRAALMLTILLLGVLGQRRWRLLDLWLLAFVLVLLIDPFAPLDMGFWLSFAAVLLIILAVHSRAQWLGVRALIRLQWLLMLGLLPLTWGLFDRVAFASLPANLLAVPLVSMLITPLALFALAMAAINPLLAVPPVLAIEYLGRVLFVVLDWLVAIFPDSNIAAPGGMSMGLFALGAVWLLMPRGWPGKPLALVLLLPAVLLGPARPGFGQFEAVVLDVGQGAAVLLRTAHHDLLYDAGPRWGQFDTGKAIVLPAMRAQGVHELDRIVVSHSAGDHAGGLPAVRDRFPATPVIGPERGGFGVAPTEVVGCPHGQEWQRDGVTFRLLQAPMRSDNDRSCVMRVSGRTGSVLLTGDVEAAAEQWLTRHADLSAEVVLVPHHGSMTSSTPTFIAATQATSVVVSAGYLNRWDHPRGEVLARWRSAGAQVFRTDRDGAIHITADRVGGERANRWPTIWRARLR